ncbi:response regulator [Massilia sp. G4R7]|uniref:Response regulator n=1 Tax=Massilia phyllostachyos TaxID=2898585 RepID=A0ABS8QDC7_9BURK|nr:response regulator [Massilia phyllostachyos]MCD2519067.1 response regulator [Massilia phyllostachyos]
MKPIDDQALADAPIDPSAFCSTRQAADLIGVSHRTIQLWVENGTLQAWKTAGGHRRIVMASIQRVLDQRRAAVAPPPAAATAAPAGRRRVLIVDDEATLLRLYELEMASWDLDLDVVKAANGFEALIRIGEQRPDILVSDLSMPGMDGFRMIRTLRADPAYADMAIIVVSGLDRATVHTMGLPEDVPFFPKPAPFAELRRAVEGVLAPAAA